MFEKHGHHIVILINNNLFQHWLKLYFILSYFVFKVISPILKDFQPYTIQVRGFCSTQQSCKFQIFQSVMKYTVFQILKHYGAQISF